MLINNELRKLFGLVKIGYVNSLLFGKQYNEACKLSINGIWKVDGWNIIGPGSVFSLLPNSCLTTSEGVCIGPFTKICCSTKIFIGKDTISSWNCQIFDTDFHYLTDGNSIYDCHGEIFIGQNVWIGNNVTILKKSYIPDFCTISSHSLINKRLTTNNCIYGGIPAELLKSGFTRVLGFRSIEEPLDEYFYNTRKNSITISNPNIKDLYDKYNKTLK